MNLFLIFVHAIITTANDNNTEYYYNGRHYRSRAEMDIAVILDEFGLEFKYDVKVKINGVLYTVDFVIVFFG